MRSVLVVSDDPHGSAEAPERAAGVPGLPDDLPKSWLKALEPETHKPYWADLMTFVAAERSAHKVYPPEGDVFNARDATFEMRNHLREEARKDPGTNTLLRRQKLLEAAAWKGEVVLRTRREGGAAVLEVRDNGIGMTEEVRANCLRTHFTTKRDNALYEGLSAGMGLGLSFVAVVLEHHGATLEIDSAPYRGTTFRVRLTLAEGDGEANGPA